MDAIDKGSWWLINHTYRFLGYIYIWMFPKIVVPQNGWFIVWKTLLKWMIWGTPIFGNIHINISPSKNKKELHFPKHHLNLKYPC